MNFSDFGRYRCSLANREMNQPVPLAVVAPERPRNVCLRNICLALEQVTASLWREKPTAEPGALSCEGPAVEIMKSFCIKGALTAPGSSSQARNSCAGSESTLSATENRGQ